jgi:hypothetical protein
MIMCIFSVLVRALHNVELAVTTAEVRCVVEETAALRVQSIGKPIFIICLIFYYSNCLVDASFLVRQALVVVRRVRSIGKLTFEHGIDYYLF